LTFVLALLVWALPAELGTVPVGTVPGRLIQARLTTTPPKIDGVLEEVWQTADSAAGFHQLTPNYDSTPGDPTVAYVLYDAENVYVAFRCPAADPKSVRAELSGSSDAVRLFLDTFDDNTTCYFFMVSVSGAEQTYRLIENSGTTQVWDGVWTSAAKVHPWGYAVEIAVPFKTLRYPRSRTDWGIEFARYAVATGEKDFWNRHPEQGFKIENFGRLTDIRPAPAGLHLEVYPVGLARADKSGSYSAGWQDRVSADGGLDLSWLPTPTANIQLTALPDFAQIEADPFTVNLGKYEIWLEERRPFFVEAAENFGSTSSSPQLFYSRRIGRPLPDGSAVPILGGAKYTDRLGRYQLGALGALTGRTAYDFSGEERVEPQGWYSVASLRRQLLTNSDVGLLYAGKDNEQYSNHGASLDGTYRHGNFTAKLLGTGSQMGDSIDYAARAEAQYSSDKLTAYVVLRQVGAKYDMNGVGYTAWRGRTAEAYAGPEFYAKGPFQYASAQLYGTMSREWDYPDGAAAGEGGFSSYCTFRNRSYASLWGSYGPTWYEDTVWHRYEAATAGGSYGTDQSKKASLSFYGTFSTKTYNYNRSVLAPSTDLSVYGATQIGDRVSVSMSSECVLEFPDTGRVELRRAATWIFRPRLDLAVTPKMGMGIANEIVRGFDVWSGRPSNSYSLAALFRYTFRPRSTVYFAWNYKVGTDRPTELVQVLKLRYLFVF
jgi:hypothetical protein